MAVERIVVIIVTPYVIIAVEMGVAEDAEGDVPGLDLDVVEDVGVDVQGDVILDFAPLGRHC